jgi:hypothetical protein
MFSRAWASFSGFRIQESGFRKNHKRTCLNPESRILFFPQEPGKNHQRTSLNLESRILFFPQESGKNHQRTSLNPDS